MAKNYDDRGRAPSPASGTGSLNALLGKGSEFDGKLSFEGTVRIDGSFTGEITAGDELIIGEGAKISAEISCGSVIVHGEVHGNIRATSAVELHQPARVKGDISTPSLVIEKGVVFDGAAKMESSMASSTPSLSSSSSSNLFPLGSRQMAEAEA